MQTICACGSDKHTPEYNLAYIVIGLDPAVTSHRDSDETGIIVAGVGYDRKAYVLADVSGKMTPDQWARQAKTAYRHWRADKIIAEANQGGDMVRHTLMTIGLSNYDIKLVKASKGKVARAEPVAALYEQGRVLHVRKFEKLEQQMLEWVPDSRWSPDRVDALVWALTELMLTPRTANYFIPSYLTA